jgi:hypothetical protein
MQGDWTDFWRLGEPEEVNCDSNTKVFLINSCSCFGCLLFILLVVLSLLGMGYAIAKYW